MNRKTLIVSMLVVIGWSTNAHAGALCSSVEDCRQKIAALEAQAQQARDAIAAQRGKANTLTREIAILQGQIKQLQAQVNTLGVKMDMTTDQITDTQGRIAQTQDTIAAKRETIGRMVLFLDRYDHQSLLASFLKYANLSAFLAQFHDLARVQTQLMAVIADLQNFESMLSGEKTDLEEQQNQLEQLTQEAQAQQQLLVNAKGQKNQVLTVTKGQEAIYQKQLTEVERLEAQFFGEMEKLESTIIAGGKFIVHVTAASLPPVGTHLFRLPEASPHLTQGYGMTAYARRGAYGGAGHNGIDYASGYGTPILAIGDGTILAHGTNDGWGNWVAIQHPNNLVSLYGHMSVFAPLPVGTAVRAGQVIGYEGATGHVTGSHVHLSIYRDFFTYINERNGQLYFNYFEGSLNPLNYL